MSVSTREPMGSRVRLFGIYPLVHLSLNNGEISYINGIKSTARRNSGGPQNDSFAEKSCTEKNNEHFKINRCDNISMMALL